MVALLLRAEFNGILLGLVFYVKCKLGLAKLLEELLRISNDGVSGLRNADTMSVKTFELS